MIDLIRQRLPQLLPNAAPIANIQPVSESRHHTVWKVTFDNGASVAAKYQLFAILTRNKPFDLLMVEQKTSALLRADGCHVPNVFATDPEYGLTISAWCGDRTLDDLCQTATPNTIADRVIDTLVQVESAFEKHQSELAPHVAPGCRREETLNTWQDGATSLSERLPELYTQLTGKNPPTGLLSSWRDLTAQIASAPLTLGPTDYNARNIAISDDGQPYVLELAKIGYDWPERRLLQYTTSLGANRPDGRFIGLLTSKRAHVYAERAAVIRNASSRAALTHLDAHHLAFCLFALQMCLAPQSPWPNPAARKKQILMQLAQTFSPNTQTRALRAQFTT